MLRDDDDARQRLERSAALERAHARRPFRLASFLGSWALGLLRAPRAPAPHPPPPAEVPLGSVALTWIGHATVRIAYPGVSCVTDPHLGTWVLAARRAVAPGIEAQALRPVDLVLVSHAHRDHLHPPTLALLAGPGTTVVVPARCADLVANLGFGRVVELDVGETHDHGKVRATLVPARHFGARRPGETKGRAYGGYVLRGEGPTLYYAGDTAYFSGFAEVGRRFKPEVAILPIGGYAPAPFRRDHMSPLDAVHAFEDTGARSFLPVRYGSFRLSHEPLDEPRTWLSAVLAERGLEGRVHLLEHGETTIVTRALAG